MSAAENGCQKNRPKNMSPFFRHFFATYFNLKKNGVTKNTTKNMSTKICNYLRIKFKLVVKKINQKICHQKCQYFSLQNEYSGSF